MKFVIALSSLLIAIAASSSFCSVSAGFLHEDIEKSIDVLNQVRDAELDAAGKSQIDFPRTASYTDHLDRMIRAYAVEVPEEQIPATIKEYSRYKPDFIRSLQSYRKLTSVPQQMHLAPTGLDGNFSVLWMTSVESEHSQVCWRPAAAGDGLLAAGVVDFHCENGSTWTYEPVTIVPWTGNVHGAHLTGLVAGAKYEYRVGDPTSKKDWSEVISFTVPRLKQDQDQDEEIFVQVGGDMGTVQLMGWKVAAQMQKDYETSPRKFDAFWHLGDITYSTVSPPKFNFEFFWDWYGQQEEPLSKQMIMMVTVGNHERTAEGKKGQLMWPEFVNRFRMPQNGRGGLDNWYWSYIHGPVKYISICTEDGEIDICDYAPGSAQYKWLERELASVNRSVTPFVIVAGHRPMYSSDLATDSGPLQKYLDELISRFHVDLQLSGHMHETELCAPVSNFTARLEGVSQVSPNSWRMVQPKAPVHITIGTLGAVINEKFQKPSPAWSLYRSGDFWKPQYGYGQLRANRTSLTVEFRSAMSNTTLWKVQILK